MDSEGFKPYNPEDDRFTTGSQERAGYVPIEEAPDHEALTPEEEVMKRQEVDALNRRLETASGAQYEEIMARLEELHALPEGDERRDDEEVKEDEEEVEKDDEDDEEVKIFSDVNEEVGEIHTPVESDDHADVKIPSEVAKSGLSSRREDREMYKGASGYRSSQGKRGKKPARPKGKKTIRKAK